MATPSETWTAEDYISKRLLPEREYQNAAAAKGKKWYHLFSAVHASAVVAAPLCATLISEAERAAWWAALIGALAALLTAFMQVFDPRSNWLIARASAERLKRIHAYYRTRTPPFDSDSALRELVLHTESEIEDSNRRWLKALDEQDHADEGDNPGTPTDGNGN